MPFREIEGHFSKLPNIDIRRSKMSLNHTVSFTGNVGDLIPFYVQEVMPGDTFNIKTSKIVRLTTSLHPTMDNLYLDTYYFYVPNRLIWEHWQNFLGENDNAWTDTTVYVPPYFTVGNSTGVTNSITKIEPGSLLNYLGLPNFTGSKATVSCTHLDLNAYIKVWNDWFRDENLQDCAPIANTDGIHASTQVNALKTWLNNTFGVNKNCGEADSCFKVARFHDIFSSCLPQPQRGADVLVPATGLVSLDTTASAPQLRRISDGAIHANGSLGIYAGNLNVGTSTSDNVFLDPNGSLKLSNFQLTVNNLRLAMQTQKLLERDARGGTRYVEIIKSHFGVDSPDARLQRSEYLGGARTLLNMSEVIQTSASDVTGSSTPLGTLAGRSSTADIDDSFIKSFVEHGLIIGVLCVRTDKTYSQGIERRYRRFNKLDYYYPVLANIGEQPIKKEQLFMSSNSGTNTNNEVFGYQEAWAEYRYKANRVCAYFDPSVSGSLASWNYADGYNSAPTLSSQWLMQGRSEVDRTLAVQSSVAHQLMFNIYVTGSMVRPMPIYSIPGLVDHN